MEINVIIISRFRIIAVASEYARRVCLLVLLVSFVLLSLSTPRYQRRMRCSCVFHVFTSLLCAWMEAIIIIIKIINN